VESKKDGKGPYQWSLPRFIIAEKSLPCKNDDKPDKPPMPIGFEGGETHKVYHPEAMINLVKTDIPALAGGNGPEPSNPQPETNLNTEI